MVRAFLITDPDVARSAGHPIRWPSSQLPKFGWGGGGWLPPQDAGSGQAERRGARDRGVAGMGCYGNGVWGCRTVLFEGQRDDFPSQ